jgi:hypothetical protein
MTSPLKSRQSPLLLITPGGVDCKMLPNKKKVFTPKLKEREKK